MRADQSVQHNDRVPVRSDDIEEVSVRSDAAEPLLGGVPTTGAVSKGPSSSQINLLRFLFFLGGLTGSTWGRFSAIYFLSKDLSPAQIGLIEGLTPMINMVAGPVWGWLSDALGSKKWVFFGSQLVGTLTLLSYACPYLSQGYYGILGISLVLAACYCPGVLTGYALDVCGPEGKVLYGRIRMWTAIAWGYGALAMGFVTDRWGFNYNFIAFGTFSFLQMFMTAWKIPDRSAVEEEMKDEKKSIKDVCKAFLRVHVLAFLAEVWLFGMGMGVVERLLFVYMKDELGASTSLCGIVVAVTVTFELPIFYYSSTIIHALGLDLAISLAYMCYIIRVWAYTLLTPETRMYILAAEVLHGPTFALTWSAIVEYARVLSPRGWSGTTNALVSMVYFSLGCGCGSLLGGWVYEHYGPIWMYRGAAALVFLLFVSRMIRALVKKVTGACC